eukprot:3239842-Rhodomonas_salina.1
MLCQSRTNVACAAAKTWNQSLGTLPTHCNGVHGALTANPHNPPLSFENDDYTKTAYDCIQTVPKDYQKTKAPSSNLRNQRPICCSPTTYKVLSGIITNRLTKLPEENGVIEPDQEGAQRLHNTKRQVQKLVHTFQDACRTQRQLFCCYVDWRNAFNSVDQEVIWQCLKLAGVHKQDIAIIRELYRGMSIRVQNSFGTTARIPLKTGTNQGDPLSPILFLVVMNVLLRKLNKAGSGIPSFVSDNPQDMQTLLNIVSYFAEWSRMEVAPEKAEISAYDFAARASIPTAAIKYRGKSLTPLHPASPFKYLGILLTLTLDWKFKKQAVRDKIAKAMAVLHGSAYTYDQLDTVVRTCIVPLFRYSAAITPWTQAELSQLSMAFELAIKQALLVAVAIRDVTKF